MSKQSKQRGFTIPELLIVMIAGTLMFGLIFNFLWEYWRFGEKAQTDFEVFAKRLDAGDYIRETVGTSSGLITQNGIADANTNVVDSIAGPSYWQTIHPVPNTLTTNGTDQPLLYFKRYSQAADKTYILNGSLPYEDEFIMYLSDNGQVRVRALANPAATGNNLQTSCPPSIASSSCPADRVIIGDVQSVERRYFSRSGNLLDYTPVYDTVLGAYVYGPDYPAVEVLEFTIAVQKRAFTENTNSTINETIIRIALRNT